MKDVLPGGVSASGNDVRTWNGRPETIETLESRLDDGFQRIDIARSRGEDVAAWEDFWIELLRRYESLCDEDRVAA